MDYYDRAEQLIELATYDESESYEVDKGGIYYDPKLKMFCFIAASGCSCWDGDYVENNYESLSLLLREEVDSESTYRPSIKGFELLAEVAAAKAIELELIV